MVILVGHFTRDRARVLTLALVLALIPGSHPTVLLGLLRPKLSYARFIASGHGQFRGLPQD